MAENMDTQYPFDPIPQKVWTQNLQNVTFLRSYTGKTELAPQGVCVLVESSSNKLVCSPQVDPHMSKCTSPCVLTGATTTKHISAGLFVVCL